MLEDPQRNYATFCSARTYEPMPILIARLRACTSEGSPNLCRHRLYAPPHPASRVPQTQRRNLAIFVPARFNVTDSRESANPVKVEVELVESIDNSDCEISDLILKLRVAHDSPLNSTRACRFPTSNSPQVRYKTKFLLGFDFSTSRSSPPFHPLSRRERAKRALTALPRRSPGASFACRNPRDSHAIVSWRVERLDDDVGVDGDEEGGGGVTRRSAYLGGAFSSDAALKRWRGRCWCRRRKAQRYGNVTRGGELEGCECREGGETAECVGTTMSAWQSRWSAGGAYEWGGRRHAREGVDVVNTAREGKKRDIPRYLICMYARLGVGVGAASGGVEEAGTRWVQGKEG
ncbi:hypothetical protein R3P38DRAFT_3371321 [Favolaschia claudopus]|uniref:Uncharacterized protein n=1 Tax=Favolaschia claudopus TaxID=2862362 RepID=A0AAV9ZXK6_9AGAR